MAELKCPGCRKEFDNNNPESLVTRGVAAAVCGTAGAIFGAEVGIVGGPIGGIAGTVPGGALGAVTGWFLADQFRRCPHCSKVFKT